MSNPEWIPTSQPPEPGSLLPPERRTVLVWLSTSALPFCGYLRYAAGDQESPYWVVYHGNPDRGADVVAYNDCLPNQGPIDQEAWLYEKGQAGARVRVEHMSDVERIGMLAGTCYTGTFTAENGQEFEMVDGRIIGWSSRQSKIWAESESKEPGRG